MPTLLQTLSIEMPSLSKPITALHVEDNPADVRLLREALLEAMVTGLKLFEARDLAEARELLNQLSVDVVLLDLSLPDSQGLETVRRVHAINAELPIIVLTGLDDEHVAVAAVRSGAQDYLVKGQFDGRLLIRTIHYAIERQDFNKHLEHLVAERTAELEAANSRLTAEIASRIEAQAALRASEESYRALFNATDEAIFVHDIDSGEIVAVNERACELYGYTADEIRQLQVAALSAGEPPYSQSEAMEHLRAAAAGEPQRFEWLAKAKAGRLFWVEVHLKRATIAGTDRLLALVTDISERKRAEAARAKLIQEQAIRAEAEAARARLGFLAEASRILATSLDCKTTLANVVHLMVPTQADRASLHLVDEDGQIHWVEVTDVNPFDLDRVRELFAIHAPSSDGTTPASIAFRTGRAQSGASLAMDLLAHCQSSKQAELIRDLATGPYVTVPIPGRERVLGTLTLVRSASDREYSDVDVALTEQLAYRAGLAIENAQLFEQAQQAVQLRNEVLSIVTHDLRNPLMSIKLAAELVRVQLSGSDVPNAEKLVKWLRTIDSVAVKMADQLNELLDVTRLEVGEDLRLDRQPVDLVGFVRQVAEELQATAQHLRIHVDANVHELVGVWDPVRINRVISNLTSNAIKYSPDGGDITIRIRQHQEDGRAWAHIEVEDQGVGIPAADLSNIFKRFYRATNAVGRFKGLGIGLSSAWQIIELHGGTMSVASVEGEGSTFTIRLPLEVE